MGSNKRSWTFELAGKPWFIREWNTEHPVLEGEYIGIDTETYLIKGNDVPDIVLATITNGSTVDIVRWDMVVDYFAVLLIKNPDSKFVFFNAPFDLEVLKKAGVAGFDALLDRRKVYDMMTRFQIEFIAEHGTAPAFYNLKSVASAKLGVKLSKDDSVRLGFTREDPPSQDQLLYAAMDAAATYELAMVMPEQPHEYIDVRSSVVLFQMTRNGIWVDKAAFDEASRRYTALLEKYSFDFRQWGVRAEDDDRTAAEIRKNICRAARINIPKGLNGARAVFVNMLAMLELPWSEATAAMAVQPWFGAEGKPPPRQVAESMVEISRSLLIPLGIGKAADLSEKPLLMLTEQIVESRLAGEPPEKALSRLKELYDSYGGWLDIGGGLIKIGDFLQKELARLETVYGIKFNQTDKKGLRQFTKNDRWMLKAYNIESPGLELYIKYKSVQKIISTFLKQSIISEDGRVHPRFNNIVSTFRTSSDSPNFQQLPKKGGVREMYGAPPGKVLVDADFSQIELCALAEHCFVTQGRSMMRELINAGVDLHRWFAGRRENKIPPELEYNGTPESARRLNDYLKQVITAEARQQSKSANFGLPGGMQPARLLAECRNSGAVNMNIEQATELHKAWFEAWPEMTEFMKPMSVQVKYDGNFVTKYIASNVIGRRRGPCGRNEACNFMFQSLTGLATKCALWDLYKAGYKMVCWVHDEVLIEIDDNDNRDAEVRKIEQIMIEGVAKLIRHVNIKVESAMSYRWSKEAKPVYDSNGRMIPWIPVKDPNNQKEIK